MQSAVVLRANRSTVSITILVRDAITIIKLHAIQPIYLQQIYLQQIYQQQIYLQQIYLH